jgi:uncharacterized membrane protein
MPDTIPRKRFDKDIELVKLQAKIQDYQTGYWATLIFILTIGITAFVAMVAWALQTGIVVLFFGGMLVALITAGLGVWHAGRGSEPDKVQLRKDIENIYNEKPIEY